MISPQVLPSVLTLTLMLLFLAGCTEPQSDSEPAVTTEMHEDFDHHHPHQHGTHHDHEHEHGDGFEGTHSHDHSHGHRHGSPLHGGRVVSIGHSHHKDGETHFHAEVMPVADDLISFHILNEDESGESVDAQVDAKEITGLISVKGDESAGHEVTFRVTADDGEVSVFTVTLPEELDHGEAYLVVIPKVVLDGQRQNFSFTASRPNQQEPRKTDSATIKAHSDTAESSDDYDAAEDNSISAELRESSRD